MSTKGVPGLSAILRNAGVRLSQPVRKTKAGFVAKRTFLGSPRGEDEQTSVEFGDRIKRELAKAGIYVTVLMTGVTTRELPLESFFTVTFSIMVECPTNGTGRRAMAKQCCEVAEDAVKITVSGNEDEFRTISLAVLKECAQEEDLVKLWEKSRPVAVSSTEDMDFQLVEHDELSWVELREAIEEYEEDKE